MATREASNAWNDRLGPRRAWGLRLLLGGLAIGGSALYAASFLGGALPARLAAAVALSAGLSWLVFGGALLALTRARPSVLAWADACLVTMGVGIVPLLVAALVNVAGWGSLSLHAGLLLVSNVTMAALFTTRARPLGLSAPRALALWLLALDLPFLVLMVVLA